MRPYIIINGMNSALVDGLLISELPNIIKPLKRTNLVEIDGRDGDIVQELGYSSYEKEITIGLYGKYDIDKVIQYFNGSGEIIFSNEPDKTYTYTILDEISYEKLNRFKTAKVKFHVQPFKHSAIEKKETFNSQIMSLGTGSKTQSGLTLSWDGHSTISASGTAVVPTRFMVEITPIKTVAGGKYNLQIPHTSSGNGMLFRICNAPTDAESLGGQAYSVSDDPTITETKDCEYHYLAIEFTAGAHTEEFGVNLVASQIEVINRGNIYSRPLMKIYGSGDVTLKINSNAVLALNITDNIVIDAEEMNAYHNGDLYNRHVLGNYANVVLTAGKNIISWEGTVTKVEIENYSRWI